MPHWLHGVDRETLRFMKPVQLLARIFVCVAFKWDVIRLCQLKQTVSTLLSYPTRVDACVLTDRADSLQTVIHDWDLKGLSVAVCNVNVSTAETDPMSLVWGHRDAMEQALACELRTRPRWVQCWLSALWVPAAQV